MQSGKDKQPTRVERITDFIQNNRRALGVGALVVTLAVIGSVVALVVADAMRGRAIASVEALGDRYEDLRFYIFWGEEGEGEREIDELLGDLRSFARGRSGYAGGRAWSMIASIYGARGQWADAEDAWLASASAAPRSHLAPIAYFNAGAAAEEQGALLRAVEHYEESISNPAGFFAAHRARFSVGRIQEALGNYSAAIDAYREVIANWPHEQIWGNFARSRIIALETMQWRLAEPVVRPDPWALWDFDDFDFGDFDFDFDDWD